MCACVNVSERNRSHSVSQQSVHRVIDNKLFHWVFVRWRGHQSERKNHMHTILKQQNTKYINRRTPVIESDICDAMQCDALVCSSLCIHFLSLTYPTRSRNTYFTQHINLWVKLSISSQQITYLQINYRVAHSNANTPAMLSLTQQHQ